MINLMDTTSDLTKSDDRLKGATGASVDTEPVEIYGDAHLSEETAKTDTSSSMKSGARTETIAGEQPAVSATDEQEKASTPATPEAELLTTESESQTAANNQQGDEVESTEGEEKTESQLDDELAGDEKVQQLQSIILRLQADIDNIRKRHDRELASAHKFSQEKLMRDLLPVLDSFDMGVRSIKETEGNKALLEGMHLTNKMLLDTLTKHALVSVEPQGEKFDPEQHEAMTIVPSPDVPVNMVIEVVQNGYTLSGRLLRPARVVVSGKK